MTDFGNEMPRAIALDPDGQPSSIPELLLIEDDDGDAKALTRALRKAEIGLPLHRVKDGVQALEFLRDPHVKEGRLILLLDVNMPRMNGHEFLAELRSDDRIRRTVVFVLTTSGDQYDVNSAYDRNVAGYIRKDAVGRGFHKLIETLQGYAGLVELPKVAGGTGG